MLRRLLAPWDKAFVVLCIVHQLRLAGLSTQVGIDPVGVGGRHPDADLAPDPLEHFGGAGESQLAHGRVRGHFLADSRGLAGDHVVPQDVASLVLDVDVVRVLRVDQGVEAVTLRIDEALERHAYTTFLRLTYEFNDGDDRSFAPDAHIRFYSDAHLAEADIVIAATSSSEPVVTREMVKRALKGRKHRPVFMVDIAVPRDIEPEIARLRDVYLYTIDDLQQVVDENMQQRSEAARSAQADVDDAVAGFMRWLYGIRANRTLQRIRRQSHEFEQDLTARAINKIRSGQDPEAVLRQMANTLTNKILHLPSKHLREAAEEQDYEVLKAADRIFRRENDSGEDG